MDINEDYLTPEEMKQLDWMADRRAELRREFPNKPLAELLQQVQKEAEEKFGPTVE